MKTKNKNDIFYIIVLILTFITMVIGVTFTFYSILTSEEKDSTNVTVGSIEINYLDGKTFDTYNLLPINEPSLDTKYSVYKKRFTIKSSGSLNQYLDIYLKSKENEFGNNALKFAIYEGNKKLNVGYIPDSIGENILLKDNVFLKSNEEKEFTILIWLQENGKSQDDLEGCKYIGGFEINAIQEKF